MQQRSRTSVVAPPGSKRLVGIVASIGCAAGLLLGGCGQRGPLVLPDAKNSAAKAAAPQAPAVAPPASAPLGAP